MIKKIYLKILFIFIIMLIFTPSKIFAYPNNIVISNSSCNNVTTGTGKDGAKDIGITGEICKDDDSTTQGVGGGMYECAQDELGIWTDFLNIKSGQVRNKKITAYYYVPFRMDSWSNDAGNWTNQSGLGIATCPNMSLNFKTTSIIDENTLNSELRGKKNAKIVSISYVDNFMDSVPSKTVESLTTWRVSPENINITSYSNGNAITNSEGNLVSNAGVYTVGINISKLAINDKPSGLGYNGTNRYLGSSGYSRAIHYFIPLKITIEYDNDEYIPNPCLEGENGLSALQYAYANPGICCDQYPETCCKDFNRIWGLRNTRPELLNFCCYGENLPYWLNNETKQKVQAYSIPTLKHPKDYFNNEISNFYNSKCPECDDIESYYYDTSINSPSYCCQQNPGEYQNRCKKPETSRPGVSRPETCQPSRCSSSSYFANNYQCCCDANSGDERCGNTTWQNTGLSCSESPTRINAPFGEGTVAEGTSTDGNTQENITFTNYYSLERMKNNIIKSGMGFDYPISVRHQILKNAPKTYDYNGYGYENARNYAIREIESYLNLTNSDKNKVIDTSSKFILSSSSQVNSEDKYIVDGNVELSDDTVDVYHSVNVCYKDTRRRRNRITGRWDEYTVTECDDFRYVTEKIYTYTYDLKLQQKYIAKDDASIATSYNVDTEKNNYLDGGTKFYTEVNTNTGIYDFYVKLDESTSGVTGKLRNYDNEGFSCQYGVVNEIKNNDKFDCGTNENPTPCPPDNNDDGKNDNIGQSFYFRPISLTNPFPNRDAGINWSSSPNEIDRTEEYITDKGDSVYGNTLYRIKLTSALISDIKEYNRKHGCYTRKISNRIRLRNRK